MKKTSKSAAKVSAPPAVRHSAKKIPTPEAEAEAFRQRLITEFQLDDAASLLLVDTACEALIRMRQAQIQLAKDGLTISDRRGSLKRHPCIGVEAASRGAMMKAIRDLRLEIDEPQPKTRYGVQT